MYNQKNVLKRNNIGKNIIRNLFFNLIKNPKKYIRYEILNKNSKERAVSDFIAGMTDRFAIKLNKELK